jgi:hypothetical protein
MEAEELRAWIKRRRLKHTEAAELLRLSVPALNRTFTESIRSGRRRRELSSYSTGSRRSRSGTKSAKRPGPATGWFPVEFSFANNKRPMGFGENKLACFTRGSPGVDEARLRRLKADRHRQPSKRASSDLAIASTNSALRRQRL